MTRRGCRLPAALCVAALLAVDPVCAAAPDEPATYRTGSYNTPTPSTLRGAQVLATEQAHALWLAKQASFVDVLPQVPRPAGLPAGTLWHQRPHEGIPGSLWLPDTGYGALAPVMQDYFERGLREATGGDRGRTLVIYCKPECWMSWNAAKRALTLGYMHVDWYPDGAVGWKQAGFPVEIREPKPRPAP